MAVDSMAGKVILEVTRGPLKGRSFSFEEHDTFVFGRGWECHARLAETDPTASRLHFLLEINPPEARIRDLGSLNGTYINGVKYGGRHPSETPQEAASRGFPEVSIRDRDQIQVGDTVFSVKVETPAVCSYCGTDIADSMKADSRFVEGKYTCPVCLDKEAGGARLSEIQAFTCRRCGKNLLIEDNAPVSSDLLCASCRKEMESNPIQELLKALAAKFQRSGKVGKTDIPGYEIMGKIGPGGMGAVYLARRNSDGTSVAVKVMLSKVKVYDDAREVFKREIDVTLRLTHPNIVSLLDHGSADNLFYFIMEYCEGGSVQALMEQRGGKLSIEEARPIIFQALDGLCYAHAQGFVHRDLNPKNILITAKEGGIAKIADLGLAKNFQQSGLSGMTVTGVALGNPNLMPREQLLNFKHVKPVSDVWGISATLYNMLTGEIPYHVEVGLSVIDAVFEGKVIPIRDRIPSFPSELARVIDKGIAVKVEERFQSAAEFRDALQGVM